MKEAYVRGKRYQLKIYDVTQGEGRRFILVPISLEEKIWFLTRAPENGTANSLAYNHGIEVTLRKKRIRVPNILRSEHHIDIGTRVLQERKENGIALKFISSTQYDDQVNGQRM